MKRLIVALMAVALLAVVAAASSGPAGAAAHDPEDKMYWADAGTDKIQRANVDVSPAVTTLVDTALSDPCTISIFKDTNPAGGTEFPFSSHWGGLRGITLNDGQSVSVSEPILCGPIFNVFECTGTVDPFLCPKLIPPGWALTNIVCTLSGPGTFKIIGATDGPTDGFEAGDNEVVFHSLTPVSILQCTFTNTETSICTISIFKDTNPAGGTGFPFSSLGILGLRGITLNDGQSISVSEQILCGFIHNVFECTGTVDPFLCPKLIPPGSALTNIVCTLSGPGTFKIIGATDGPPTDGFEAGDNEVVFHSLTPVSILQCTFTNTVTPIVVPTGNKYCITGTSTGVGWPWTVTPSFSGSVAGVPFGGTAILIATAWVDSMDKAGVNVSQLGGANQHCFNITPGGQTLTVDSCTVTASGCSFNPTVFEVTGVGGIVELRAGGADASAQASASSSGLSAGTYAVLAAAIAGAAAAVVALAAGGWYARRRWLR